jgi:hypothetical protein
MQFETPARTISSLYQNPSGHHLLFEIYMNPFPCHIANPLKNVFNLNTMIPHSVHLVNPFTFHNSSVGFGTFHCFELQHVACKPYQYQNHYL